MKLSRLSLGLAIAAASTASYSASNIIPVGPNLGYGDASSIHTVFSSSNNPAWVGANLHNENNYGVGMTGGMLLRQTNAKELGDGFSDDVSPILDRMQAAGDGAQALQESEELKAVVNALILDVRDKFKIHTAFNGSLPVVVTNVNYGGFGVEVSGLQQLEAKLLSSDRPIDINTDYISKNPKGITETDEDYSSRVIKNGIIAQSAFYSKVAFYGEASLSYANQIYSNQYGILSVGAKGKLMQARLRKSINDIGTYLNAVADDESLSEIVEEDFSAMTSGDTESQFGVDLGAMWISSNWYGGFTLMNINSPTFTYNKLGTGPLTDDRANIERFYANQINNSEEVILNMQGRLEGALFTENRMWTFAGAIDTNETVDLVNNPYQWVSASASFASSSSTNSWWWIFVPDVRLGYRANLVGDEESYITPGFTWGPLNMDFAMSSDAISSIQSGEAPSGFAGNIGLEVYF